MNVFVNVITSWKQGKDICNIKDVYKMSVAKGEKLGFVVRVKKLYRGVVSELKKVHWPNRKEIATYTSIVLLSVVIVGIVIWIFDSIVGYLMSFLI